MRARFVIVSILVVTLSVVPALVRPAGAAGIPVIDVANLAQKILGYIKQLFAIAQRAVQIANQVTSIEFWVYNSLNWLDPKYRESVLAFLEDQALLLYEFDQTVGQYQALSTSLEAIGDEFDVTFPGWRAVSELAAGQVLRIRTEAGDYSFSAPEEFARYRVGRSHQLMRQSLGVMRLHHREVTEAQEHLEGLKLASLDIEGQQQMLHLLTSYGAVTAEQIVGLRASSEVTNQMLSNMSALFLDQDMQAGASMARASEALGERVTTQFGDLVPAHSGVGGLSPYPAWMGR